MVQIMMLQVSSDIMLFVNLIQVFLCESIIGECLCLYWYSRVSGMLLVMNSQFVQVMVLFVSCVLMLLVMVQVVMKVLVVRVVSGLDRCLCWCMVCRLVRLMMFSEIRVMLIIVQMFSCLFVKIVVFSVISKGEELCVIGQDWLKLLMWQVWIRNRLQLVCSRFESRMQNQFFVCGYGCYSISGIVFSFVFRVMSESDVRWLWLFLSRVFQEVCSSVVVRIRVIMGSVMCGGLLVFVYLDWL